ncbi:MAG: ATP-dependent RNA helicase HrpA [Luminiphilus sp.]|nr:ATP-dependent RNA helicase HrpA [Luminiphilus sp.]
MTTSQPARERVVPEKIDFPEQLPVCERRGDIENAIQDHQVVILAGETGSGKTTQLPKICLNLGRGRQQRIGHTQPRRIAARTVGQRIAEELNTSLGGLVGYQIRFNDTVSEATAIKLMTDGILLAELTHDPDLTAYDTLIIDEAHERSLNIDFLLGYLKQLLPRRPDLKVIVTSATIDVERFSEHFNGAPVIEVSGRTYPVEMHYVGDTEDRDEGVRQQIADLLAEIEQGRFGPRGDTLVFLPGERDIRELARALRHNDRLRVLPLYARLSQAEQNRVFQSGGAGMRVVLATNVAETSLTVPGIRYVIDPGEARISRYSVRSRLQRLPIEPISQASANQRMGRCGRLSDGVCFRLYSEQDFLGRAAFTDPEIRRTNLAAVVLRMLELGLGEVDRFPFIDPPDPKVVRDGYRLLEELDAVSARGKLTALGRQLARLPVDPRLGRMLLAANELKCLPEVLVIVSAMSIQDPRERPTEKQAQADQAHARFQHPRSDFLAWIALWRYFEEQRQALSQNQLRKLCQREYFAYMRMREWREIHGQLVLACRQLGFRVRPQLPDEEAYEAIHRALLTGLLGNVAQRDEGKEFNATRNRKTVLFPGSGQYKKPPPWMVAGEIIETTQVYARQCAAIEPDWLLRVNPRVLKRHHYEPAWQRRTGRVMAKERVTLYGLTVSDGRRVHFGDIDPETSRTIFISNALVTGNVIKPPLFLKENLSLMRSVEELESRTRRRDLLIEEEALVRFYDERLAPHCVGMTSLIKWLKQDPSREGNLLLKRDQILVRDPGAEVEAQFPPTLNWQGVDYQLRYQFEPGRENDGVSITIPLPLLNRAPRYLFDWLVPGLLRDKCIALIKGLPKSLRKQLVPAPDVVDAALSELIAENADLCAALSQVLKRQRGVQVGTGDWQPGQLEDFYRMNVRVVDATGKLLGQGRDMAALVAEFRTGEPAATTNRENSPERNRVERWDFGELPAVWKSRAAGLEVIAHPAVVAEAQGIAVRLLDYPGEALLAHEEGLVALATKQASQLMKSLRKALFAGNELVLAFAAVEVDRKGLAEDVIAAVAHHSLKAAEPPRSEEAFKAWFDALRSCWHAEAVAVSEQIAQALKAWALARTAVAKLNSDHQESQDDCWRSMSMLLSSATVRYAGGEWLAQYPRYAKAAEHRMSRLNGQYLKDQKALELLVPWLAALSDAEGAYPGLIRLSPEAYQYRWMLEEFRVSLFAQQMKTRLPVSAKRLEQQWQQVQAWMEQNPR